MRSLGVLFSVFLCTITLSSKAQTVPQKAGLPFPGDTLSVSGRQAFLIASPKAPADRAKPWVLYAPTLSGLPGNAERWMFQRFLDEGIAIAGIDVGESYGSPDGRALYSALHPLTKRMRQASQNSSPSTTRSTASLRLQPRRSRFSQSTGIQTSSSHSTRTPRS